MGEYNKNLEQGELIAERKKLSTEQRKYITSKVKELAGGVAIKIVNIRNRMKTKLGGNVNQLYADQMPEIEFFLAEIAEKNKSKEEKAAELGKAFMNKQAQKDNPKIILPSVVMKETLKEQGEMTCSQVTEQNELEIYKRLEEIRTEFDELQHKKIIDIKLQTLDAILGELREIKEKI